MFGDKLKELRKSKNLTQEDIGDFCGVGKATISNWENNLTDPPIETITKLANYFDVTPNYLLNFTQDEEDEIERLKQALKEAGMWDYSIDDMSKEDFEKAMQIVAMLKEKK